MHCDSDFSLKSVTSEVGYNKERSGYHSENDRANEASGGAGMAIIINIVLIIT